MDSSIQLLNNWGLMYNLLSLPIFVLLAENTQAQPCKNKMDDANCEHWAGLGYCQSRGLFMLDKCQHACNSCPKGNFSSPRDRKRILLRGIHTKALLGLPTQQLTTLSKGHRQDRHLVSIRVIGRRVKGNERTKKGKRSVSFQGGFSVLQRCL